MIDGKPTSLELFAGAGGLALGTELAGFTSLGTIEWDRWACETMRDNIRRGYPLVSSWAVHEADVRLFPWDSIEYDVDLLAGGPPCQPFSIGGAGRAHEDLRDMFPAMIAAVHALRPKAFVVENVKGLLRAQFTDYYQYILLRLEFPERAMESGETWIDHLRRLQKIKSSGAFGHDELTYNVLPTLVNAADYGVPQKRERVFIVGFRSDLGIKWSFPNPTHSLRSLQWEQRPGGEYWERHGISPNSGLQARMCQLDSHLLPWRTVRDAIQDLPTPTACGTSMVSNHELREGARAYPGHTGSILDMPSKTLKAGVHGVPGGENMFIQDNGEPRYYTVREAARIQTFPDGYCLNGAWSEVMRQLGNAVPVVLAQVVMRSIAQAILRDEIRLRTDQAKGQASRWAI